MISSKKVIPSWDGLYYKWYVAIIRKKKALPVWIETPSFGAP